MNRDQLTVTSFRGSAESVGAQYGRTFIPRIVGFCKQELRPDRRKLAYARRCWPHVLRHAPESARFIRGLARGAGLSLDHAVLLSLHEEVYHQPHCTAFLSPCRRTVNAMNWDWATNLYPWPGLLRLSIRGAPRLLSYHYPGLWACAGVNEAGLSLMWTGGGYLPKVQPTVGVPTYVLIAQVLRLRRVEEALAYLDSLTHAGCFLFFIADAKGHGAVVEGSPGVTRVVRTSPGGEPLYRSNHYLCPDVVRRSRQSLRGVRGRSTTCQRLERIEALVSRHRGRITPGVGRRILTDRHGPWPWLHQYPAAGSRDGVTLASMTIDSLLAVSQDRVLHTCRGGREHGPWQTVAV